MLLVGGCTIHDMSMVVNLSHPLKLAYSLLRILGEAMPASR